MSEIMDEKQGDINQSPDKENVLNVKDATTSLEDKFNSTFVKLEAMQEEIMLKKIAELEEQLCELEAFAMKIINEG